MTPHTPTAHATPQRAALFADLPPTMAGLWTAVTMPQNIAAHLAQSPPARGRSSADAGADAGENVVVATAGDAGVVDAATVALQCAQASDVLSSSRSDLLGDGGDRSYPVAGEPRHPDFDLGALTDGCIELAVEVLGNEHEPLDTGDILAITCAVSALCTARTAAIGDRS